MLDSNPRWLATLAMVHHNPALADDHHRTPMAHHPLKYIEVYCLVVMDGRRDLVLFSKPVDSPSFAADLPGGVSWQRWCARSWGPRPQCPHLIPP